MSKLLVSPEREYVPGNSENNRMKRAARDLKHRYALNRLQIDRLGRRHAHGADSELAVIVGAHHVHFAIFGQQKHVIVASSHLDSICNFHNSKIKDINKRFN